MVKKSSIAERYFNGKASVVTRTKIGDALLRYVGRGVDEEGKGSAKDIARLYVLLVFNCILFPLTHYQTPAYVIHYVDKLKRLKQYAWGHAAYSFLLQSISSHSEGTTKYVCGCTVGLLVSAVFCIFSYI